MLPLPIGPAQDVGVLGGICDMPCTFYRSRKLNGAEVSCIASDMTVELYQLGDHLYIVDGDRVRQVALPCGVELDFYMPRLDPSYSFNIKEVD
ncbi:MAG: hypothetical protein IPM54_11590 [Polyangiaceae bacterium]|nr:hypothetical protein [Polyangiaceae bacterium]